MRFLDAEDLGDAVQELAFALMHHAVGLGDVEQAVENVLQHRAVGMAGAAHLRHALGIDFETGHVLLGQVEQPRHIVRLLGRHLEYFLERAHFVLGDDAVGLGHLGRQRDHRHRKGDAAAQVRVARKQGAHCLDKFGDPRRWQRTKRVQ